MIEFEDIKREIISLMRELRIPVAGKMLTVVNVTVSNDLSCAKVYISAMSGIEEAKTACKGALLLLRVYIRRASVIIFT